MSSAELLKLFRSFEIACERYWQNDMSESISDDALRMMYEAMHARRRDLVNAINALDAARSK